MSEVESLAAGLPGHESLAQALDALLAGQGLAEHVEVIARRRNRPRSTSPIEVVVCRLDRGRSISLLCKYDISRPTYVLAPRRGLRYEARVYREVLETMPLTSPRFFGVWEGSRSETPFMVLEYLAESERGPRGVGEQEIAHAARWLGEFHRYHESYAEGSASFLTTFDTRLRHEAADRAVRFASKLTTDCPWLGALCEGFKERASLLCGPVTVVHGDFYRNNVIAFRGGIYPIDWESAALAVGEIDLATLIEGWPGDTVAECAGEYARTRWPAGSPETFTERLNLSRVFSHLRWLAHSAEWATHPDILWRYDDLKTLGKHLNLI